VMHFATVKALPAALGFGSEHCPFCRGACQ
jgi:hypothetical protein